MTLLPIVLAAAASAAGATTTYFAGEARIIAASTASGSSSERVLLVRLVEPAGNRIVEHACVVPDGQAALLSSAYLRIAGDAFTISDRESGIGGQLTGTGRLVGVPWLWTELHFDMLYALPRMKMQVRNLNLVVPGRLLARKQVAIAEGAIVQLWETELEEVAPARFRSEWERLSCPPL